MNLGFFFGLFYTVEVVRVETSKILLFFHQHTPELVPTQHVLTNELS